MCLDAGLTQYNVEFGISSLLFCFRHQLKERHDKGEEVSEGQILSGVYSNKFVEMCMQW